MEYNRSSGMITTINERSSESSQRLYLKIELADMDIVHRTKSKFVNEIVLF